MSNRKPQIFGTQYMTSDSGLVLSSPYDTTAVADSIRNSYSDLSETLRRQQIRLGKISLDTF